MRRTLILMVKEPRPGRVKTRLGREIGMVRAAWWMRHQVRRLIRDTRDPRWRTVLAVTPDRSVPVSQCWPKGLPRWPQGSGDLGMRMRRLLCRARPVPTCLVGTDIPGMNRTHIARAFSAMRGCDLIFGPSGDGGFWLVGTRRYPIPAGLFESVRWSSRYALADTCANISQCRVALVQRMNDVDSAADLVRYSLTGDLVGNDWEGA